MPCFRVVAPKIVKLILL